MMLGHLLLVLSGGDVGAEKSLLKNGDQHPREVSADASPLESVAQHEGGVRSSQVQEVPRVLGSQKLRLKRTNGSHNHGSGKSSGDEDEPHGVGNSKVVDIGETGDLRHQSHHKDGEELSAHQEALHIVALTNRSHELVSARVTLLPLLGVHMLAVQNGHLQSLQVRHQRQTEAEDEEVQDGRAGQHGLVGPDSPHDVHKVRDGHRRRDCILHILGNLISNRLLTHD
mmetsp:Transcript_18459/g.28575  ORF Transcript_18459/g.28575 Transcript_18459/m.28575 type:complete len:227 (+) Transcript_18459:592-1272(+)